MSFTMEQFEPKKEELLALVDECSGLVINGVEDKEGYEKVRQARLNLKKTRVDIEKTGKNMRDEANKFAKMVIAKENEYVALIEPTEKKLQAQENEYDRLLEIEKRKESLPDRKAMLDGLAELSDDQILSYDDTIFTSLIVKLKQEKFEADRQKLEQEKAQFEAEKQARELEERQKQEALEAEAKAKADEERRKQEIADAQVRAAEQARLDAEKKAQAEIDRLNKQAADKEAAEKQAKIDAEIAEQKRLEAEKAEEEKIRKNKAYKKFLADNSFNELTDKVERDGEQFVIYRAIAKITIH